jgi:hypothetical protein
MFLRSKRSPITTATVSKTLRSASQMEIKAMGILNGNGDGTFQPPVLYLVPSPQSSVGTVAIVSANLNDNKADIALGIGGANPSFAVLINSTGVAPPPTPSAPTLLSPAQDATPAQPVALDWTDVTAATSYRIQIDDSSVSRPRSSRMNPSGHSTSSIPRSTATTAAPSCIPPLPA